MSKETPDYEVGYRKPPKHGQFQKGQSGNAKGRPKKVAHVTASDDTDVMSLIRSEGERQIALTENGKTQHVSFKQALVKAAYPPRHPIEASGGHRDCPRGQTPMSGWVSGVLRGFDLKAQWI